MKSHEISKFNLTLSERRIVTLAGLGGMLEFYDFIIYGIFSLYFANQFFPSSVALMSIMASYLVFILGYITRPIGGIIFSHIGDEYGRKQVLVITIVLMGLASLLIGILPTYQQIGIAAPILLISLRLLQGLAIGGELPSTYVYVTESITHKSGTAFGTVMGLTVFGLLIGMLLNVLLTTWLNLQQLTDYGWRVPFILGGALCLVSYKIRKTLHETTAFSKITKKSKFPLFDLLKNYPSQVLVATALTATLAASIIIFVVFMPTYLGKIVTLEVGTTSHMMVWVILVVIFSSLIMGRISNHFAPTILLKFVLILEIMLVGPSYYFISHHIYILLCLFTLGVLTGALSALVPAIISTLFPAQVRLSGVALSYNLGFSIFGGLAPVIITLCIKNGANIYLVPVIYIWIICLLALFGLMFMNKIDES